VTVPSIHQTVIGHHNIFTGAGDVRVTYELAPAEGEDRHNLLTLLDSVKRFWIDDRLEGSIHKDVLRSLSMKTLPEAIDHPWKMILGLPDQASRQIPQDKNIADVFVEMGRLLLILGEPGSGKTTTLLQLARSLIEAARIDPTKPVPVVFHLSSWSEKRQGMLEWLVEELRTKYYIPPRLSRSFLMSNRVLPLLDGLDEVSARYQSACVESINHFAREVGIPGLVVCSRFSDYAALPQRLKVYGAVYLQQLTFEQIDDYMSGAGERLEALRLLVQEDIVLQTVAGSPLMLDVMVSAYQDLTIDALKDDKLSTTEARRENVFKTYAKRMFERRSTDNQSYTQEQTMLWVSWLANNMRRHSQSIFLIERMQPSWMLNRGELVAYILASRLALGVVLGLAFSVERLLDFEQPLRERLGFLFCSITVGLILGTLAYLLKARQSVINNQPAHAQDPSRWQLGLHVTLYTAVAGLMGGLIGGFVGWLWLKLYLNSASPNSESHGLAVLWFTLSTASPNLPMLSKSIAFMVDCGFGGGIFGLAYGLFFGLIVGVREKQRSFGDDIQTAETLSWTPARARKAVKWVTWRALLIGLFGGAVPLPFLFLLYLVRILIAINQPNSTPPNLLQMVVKAIALAVLGSVWLFVGFSLVLLITFGGLAAAWGGLNTSRLVESRDLTNRGIKTSLKNSMWAAAIAAGSIVFVSLIWVLVGYGLQRAIPQWPYVPVRGSELVFKYLLIFVVWAMVAGLWYGGTDIIKHYTLRLILFCKGNAPRRFDTFLAYAVKLGFMQKVGGGYIFIHSLLRDYFAGRVASPRKA
jgi:eukaryotic-like serine/threonine-protein kinase